MAELNIYDQFGEHLELHHIDVNLNRWLKENVPSYKESIRPPYSATLNGKPWPYINHSDKLNDDDIIDLVINPQNVGVIAIVVSLAAAAYAYYVASNVPSPNGYQNSTPEDGQSIYRANARANKATPSGVIRTVAGKAPIFPDLICPPHRKYVDHAEFLYLMLSVGEGYYFIQGSNLYIDETKISNYAGTISFNIFEPGDDVSGEIAHEHWYESREVSDLKLTTDSIVSGGSWTVDANGDEFTSYLNGIAETFPFAVDEVFEMTTGSNQGVYRVSAISGASNEIATVVLQDPDEDVNQQLIVSRQRIGIRGGRDVNEDAIRLNAYNDASSTTLNPVTGESIDWNGVNGGVRWFGPYEIIPINETCRFLEVDVNFPGGLVKLVSGQESSTSVEIEIQYREVGTNGWTTVSSTTYTDSTYDERGYTVDIDMGSLIRPEVRFRRKTIDSTSVDVSDDVFIKRVKAKLSTATSYSDVTTIALDVKGTSAIARSAENKFNIRNATRKLPTINELKFGSAGAPINIGSSITQSTGQEWELTNPTLDYADQPDTSESIFIGFDLDVTGTYLSVSFGNNYFSYQLSTPFDLREKTLIGANQFKNTPAVSGRGARWGEVGDNLFVINSATVYRYKMTSSYNVSTANYASDSLDLTTEINVVDSSSFSISDNGLKIYACDEANKIIYQYDGGVAWDLSSFSYSSKSLNVSSETGSSTLRDAYIANSGTRLYTLDDQGITYSYTLSTAYDISTATYDGVSYTAVNVDSESFGVLFVYQDYLFVTETEYGNARAFTLSSSSDTRSTRSIMRFVANEIYNYLGSEAENLVDWDTMSTLDTTLESRADYLDCEFIDETNLWEAIKIMLAPGYCEPASKDGKFTPIRTVDGSNYTHLYTPDIMLGDGLKIVSNFYKADESDGVDVEYLDEDSLKMEIVECRLAGDAGLKPKRLQAVGIINRDRAWRLGMIERRRMFYKPDQYQFSTEMDGLNSDYGDPIAISSDLFSSQFGTVTSVSGSTITVDFDPTFGVGSTFAVFKKPDGEFSGLYVVNPGASSNQMTLTTPTSLDFTPVTDASPDSDGENTLVAIGVTGEWGVRSIIRKIETEGTDQVTITAEEHVSEIYDDIDNNEP